jgi:cytochrome P450
MPIQFGQGSRICSGRHISLLELNKTLVELFRNFDMELADPKFELTWTTMWFMKPSSLPVVFKERHPEY